MTPSTQSTGAEAWPFFPGIGAVNPSLTAIADALRVGSIWSSGWAEPPGRTGGSAANPVRAVRLSAQRLSPGSRAARVSVSVRGSKVPFVSSR
jgi:hypothetical protein